VSLCYADTTLQRTYWNFSTWLYTARTPWGSQRLGRVVKNDGPLCMGVQGALGENLAHTKWRGGRGSETRFLWVWRFWSTIDVHVDVQVLVWSDIMTSKGGILLCTLSRKFEPFEFFFLGCHCGVQCLPRTKDLCHVLDTDTLQSPTTLLYCFVWRCSRRTRIVRSDFL
jgi:hypothetical protein